MKNEPLYIGRCEMKYPGFPVIDPDNGVIAMRFHVQALSINSIPIWFVLCRAVIDQPQQTVLE
jgi:hypothetical protein